MYFVAVVDEAHFTRAAERLRIAQPAVSQQIRRLEAELGERLLHRDRRTVTLTPAGEALLPHARAALAQAEHGQQAVAALRGLVTGQLRIGFVMPLPDRSVIRAIGAFARRYPGIELTLMEDETDGLLDRLATGDLQTAFIGLGPGQQPPANLNAVVVAREPVVLVVHSSTRSPPANPYPSVSCAMSRSSRSPRQAACGASWKPSAAGRASHHASSPKPAT